MNYVHLYMKLGDPNYQNNRDQIEKEKLSWWLACKIKYQKLVCYTFQLWNGHFDLFIASLLICRTRNSSGEFSHVSE